jgi:hypothetical protein
VVIVLVGEKDCLYIFRLLSGPFTAQYCFFCRESGIQKQGTARSFDEHTVAFTAACKDRAVHGTEWFDAVVFIVLNTKIMTNRSFKRGRRKSHIEDVGLRRKDYAAWSI